MNASNWDEFRSKCVTTNMISHQIEQGDLEGADGLLGWMQGMKTAFPDWRLQPQIVLVNGRNLFAVELSTGTHRGVLKSPMGDIAPTNKNIGQLFFHRIAITEELKGAEEWAYQDPMGMLGQLGKLPGHPTRKARTTGLEGAPIIVVAADNDKERQNLATVTKWNALFSAHKNKELMALYSDDALEADQADPADWKGKRAIEQGNRQYFAAFSNGRLETANLFAAGDYVVSLGRFTGTNDGNFGDMKKTGKDVSLEYAEVIRIDNGKVAQVLRFRNGLALLEQLGMQPKAGTQSPTKRPAKR